MTALSMVTHAAGVALISMSLAKSLGPMIESPRYARGRFVFFSVVVGVASVLLALLHGIEASYRAAVYVWPGAVPDFRRAIFFSLQMVTTLGSSVVDLGDRWKLMGPLEAIGDMLLFGLSAAFLFAIMLRVWPFPQTIRGGVPEQRS